MGTGRCPVMHANCKEGIQVNLKGPGCLIFQ
ncbi:hypothetical protein BRW83_1483 [Oxalobacter formigenes]|nr:hypothetical protein BRW83_1483 [Oxalobacter formigenes]